MSKDYRGYLTQAGLNYESTAHALGKVVNIAKIGIGNGVLPDDQSPMGLTTMVNKIAEFPAKVYQDEKNPGVFVAECAIPAEHAINGTGYYINEMSAILDNGILYAYRRVSGDFKPLITSGEAKSYLYRLRFIPQNAGVVNVTIDPSVVWPTLADLKREIQRHEESRNHPDASLTEKGFVQLSSATDSTSETLAATPKSVKTVHDLAAGKYTAEDATTAKRGLVQLSSVVDSDVENKASTPKATKIAMDNANARLAKNRNGEDIPNKQLFVENIGAVPKTITINGKPLNNNIVLSSADTNSFPLSSSGTYPDVNAVPWNAPSGTYVAHDVGSTRLILHFNTNEGSCPAVQFLVDYRNGGISYRSARDQSGFEDLWTPLDCYPAGAPIPWPSDILPSDGKYIFMTGQAFDKAKYPRLAKAYPSGILPDMRGQTIKGKPVSGRAVLSYELDGIKSHTHAASASTTDLGTKNTTSFDYGNKSSNASGDHQHAYTTFAREGGGGWGFYANAQNAGDKLTTAGGNHVHTVYIGAHVHQVYIGEHGHVISVTATGNPENTVKNIALNYIVRLA